jgi:hypothetical protein
VIISDKNLLQLCSAQICLKAPLAQLRLAQEDSYKKESLAKISIKEDLAEYCLRPDLSN